MYTSLGGLVANIPYINVIVRLRADGPLVSYVVVSQDRVVSGVGNWVADEVCFQARVHPGAACNTLAPEQVNYYQGDKSVDSWRLFRGNGGFVRGI